MKREYYLEDPISFDSDQMAFVGILVDEEDPEYDKEISLPAKYAVCDRCNGKGKHVHSGVDGHGIASWEFDEDPDFREAYFRGDYDVICEECKGLRVCPVIDEGNKDLWTEDQKKLSELWDDWQESCWANAVERQAERAMGC